MQAAWRQLKEISIVCYHEPSFNPNATVIPHIEKEEKETPRRKVKRNTNHRNMFLLSTSFLLAPGAV
jgi:hypothetical protein